MPGRWSATVTDTAPFALIVLLTAAVGLVAVLSNRLTERVKLPSPALVLVGAAIAVKVIPAPRPLTWQARPARVTRRSHDAVVALRSVSRFTFERTCVLMDLSSHQARTCVLIVGMSQVTCAFGPWSDASSRRHPSWPKGACRHSGRCEPRTRPAMCAGTADGKADSAKIITGAGCQMSPPEAVPAAGIADSGP
jgi:hypothetical protein